LELQATYSIRRVAREMKKRTSIRLGKMVSTVRKSQANMLVACARKKVRHDEYVRCGAGWRPASSSTLRTDVAETEMARPLSSATIRL
jgi:hypothetical protein